jgi:hypothetical protein
MRKIINKSLFILVFCFCFLLLTDNIAKAECRWVEGVERSGGPLGNGKVIYCDNNFVESANSKCDGAANTPNFYDTYIDEYQRRIWICCCEVEKEETATKAEGFIPQVTIPGSNFIKGTTVKLSPSTQTLAEYIKAIYNYMLAVVGLLAAVVIMIGGVVWLTAGGNTERISQAKSWIGGSLIGLILALTSFLLLRIINPNLVDFKITEIKTIRPIEQGCCSSEKSQDKAFMTTSVGCYEVLLLNGETVIVSDDDLDKKYEGSYTKYLSGKFFVGDYIVKDGSCHLLTEEEKKASEEYCKGKGIGDDWGESSWNNGYCYNEKLYDGFPGKENEPCGNNNGSRCVPSDRCDNKDRGIGTRSCETSLKCCETSGIKTINNSVCEGVSNGYECNNVEDCWCYDNIPWQGKGASSTPCGIKPGAVCMMDSCDNGYSWDRSGGTRSCISSYFCCAPD